MGYVDWRGAAMAIAQLKELTEPNKMELMEREYELRAIEGEKDRAFEGSKHQFDYWQDEHTENKKRIKETEKNITEMNASAQSLKPEYQSINMGEVIQQNDITRQSTLQTLNADLEAKVGTQMTYLQEITDLYNNMMYGKQLRETQGGAKFKYFTEQKTDGESSWEETTSWDFNRDGIIDPEEYDKALDKVIDMQPKGTTKGVREGFYSGFNPIETEQDNIQQLVNQIDYEKANIELETAEIELKTDKEDPYGILANDKKVQLSISNQIVKDDAKKKREKIEAFGEFYSTQKLLVDNSTAEGDWDSDGAITEVQHQTTKAKMKKILGKLGSEVSLVLAKNKLLDKGDNTGNYLMNNYDFVDHGFTKVLEEKILNYQFNASDPEKNMHDLVDTKRMFNNVVKYFDKYVDGDMTETEKEEFKADYDLIVELFPDDFKDVQTLN